MLAPLTLRHPFRPAWPVRPGFRKIPMNKFAALSILSAAIVLSCVAGCASTQKQESTGQYVDDTAITAKVKSAILKEPDLKSAEINVETFKGRVQLSGFVSSRASIDRAVAVTQAVSGVSSVTNDMRVK
jgi:osmotically-inducible protein OsmY